MLQVNLVSLKIRDFPLKLCPKLRTLEIWPRQVFDVINNTLVVVDDGRVCCRHLYDNRRVVAVFYKTVNCNSVTSLLRFVADLLYNSFLQLTRFCLTHRVALSVCGSRASCDVSGTNDSILQSFRKGFHFRLLGCASKSASRVITTAAQQRAAQQGVNGPLFSAEPYEVTSVSVQKFANCNRHKSKTISMKR